jgi:hypothetical protein
MKLMENKYLKFGTIMFNGVPVRNITEINILPDIPEKFYSNNYTLVYEVRDNQLIENIAFELYENTDYWDLLMKFNGIRNVAELPVNYDTILLRVRKSLSIWIDAGKLMVSRNLSEQYTEVINILNEGVKITLEKAEDDPDEIVKRKYLELLEEELQKNEKFRKINYLSVSDMAELESALDIAKENPKINPDIIINKDDVQ